MKTEEFKRRLIDEQYLSKWVTGGTWKWNKDNSVTVLGNLNINEYNAKDFNVKFKKVTGWFHVSLPSASEHPENFPKSVERFVYYDRFGETKSMSNDMYKKLLEDTIKEKLKKEINV